MCGIAGFFCPRIKLDNIQADIAAMTETLTHRGPDDGGAWFDDEAGIALGHRRLSIIDLTVKGHQPMASPSGRYVAVFNGEIYNFKELRRNLVTDSELRGNSDTEVMLAAIEEWGLETAVRKFVGMFAIAIWDRKDQRLHLVRDRIGEKPLYYGWSQDVFLFGSELKALCAFRNFSPIISRDVLALYMSLSYVPAPYSIYEGIYKLEPGEIRTIEDNGECSTEYYWNAKEMVDCQNRNRFFENDADVICQLDQLLRATVAKQMISDVPLGAFLSGGIDSSTVVALMQSQTIQPVKTFTIGFHETGFNEALRARAIAKHLGTDHTELYVTPQETLEVIPKIPVFYDEPFADPSQIPTYLVARLAKQNVTVSLSGDGGDELFGGYNRYFWGRSIWNKMKRCPAPLRMLFTKFLTSCSPGAWDGMFRIAGPFLPNRLRQPLYGDKIHKLAEVLKSPEMLYQNLTTTWKDPVSLVVGSKLLPTTASEYSIRPGLTDFAETMMFLDLITYLPDDILVKLDRAAMGTSLETRIPFLDHQVVEFAWSLPIHFKIRNGQGKWILRQVLKHYIPTELTDQPKTGFGLPIGAWLRGPLKDWSETLLQPRRMMDEGYLNPGPIRQKWEEHLSGKRNWQYYLWNVLMFQAWLDSMKQAGMRL